MTSINNLRGRIISDGKVVYSEELKKGIVLAIIQKFDSNESILTIEATITSGLKHTWGNGVVSLIEAQEIEQVQVDQNFRDLTTLTTIHGFKVKEYEYNKIEFNRGDTKIKERNIRWLIEIPKEDLIKFFEK